MMESGGVSGIGSCALESGNDARRLSCPELPALSFTVLRLQRR